MTTIDKQSFKITIPSIVSIIACTTTIIMFLYSFRDQNTNENNSIKMSIQKVEDNQELVAYKLQAQIELNKNNYRRDSANTSQLFKKIEAEIKETQSILIRERFAGRTVSLNELPK